MGIDGVVIAVVAITPDLIEQLGAAEGAQRLARKVPEQIEFARCQRQLGLPQPSAPLDPVDVQGAGT